MVPRSSCQAWPKIGCQTALGQWVGHARSRFSRSAVARNNSSCLSPRCQYDQWPIVRYTVVRRLLPWTSGYPGVPTNSSADRGITCVRTCCWLFVPNCAQAPSRSASLHACPAVRHELHATVSVPLEACRSDLPASCYSCSIATLRPAQHSAPAEHRTSIDLKFISAQYTSGYQAHFSRARHNSIQQPEASSGIRSVL